MHPVSGAISFKTQFWQLEKLGNSSLSPNLGPSPWLEEGMQESKEPPAWTPSQTKVPDIVV